MFSMDDDTTVDELEQAPQQVCQFCGEPLPRDFIVYVADDAFCSSLCAHYFYRDANHD